MSTLRNLTEDGMARVLRSDIEPLIGKRAEIEVAALDSAPRPRRRVGALDRHHV